MVQKYQDQRNCTTIGMVQQGITSDARRLGLRGRAQTRRTEYRRLIYVSGMAYLPCGDRPGGELETPAPGLSGSAGPSESGSPLDLPCKDAAGQALKYAPSAGLAVR